MPQSVKVPVGGRLHDLIKNSVMERKRFSEIKMKESHKRWNDAEDSMKAYIRERDVDKARKDKKSYDGELDYVSLEIPYAYAIVMTMHTYFSSVMLARNPVFQFTGRHGESQDSIMAVEAVMDYQLRNGGMLPVMYNWLYDLCRYSLGIVGAYFDKEEKIVSHFEKQQTTLMGIPFSKEKLVRVEEIVPGYVGNKLFNVRPYDFYPDPRNPLWKFQEGEFCIHETSEGYFNILATQHTEPGYYCNLVEMENQMKSQGNSMFDNGSSRLNMPFGPEQGNAPGPGSAKITDAYVKLIPSVWGLGDSKRIEIWCFQLANQEVVISAKPLGLYHNKFPFSLMEGSFGSDEFSKVGTLEMIRPLTDIMTWLVNSHFYNVRRVLNNQLVIDPSRIVVKDLTKPGQRVIRLKPSAYGQDVKNFIHQLVTPDVTRTNLADTQFVGEMVQRTSAVADNVMGMLETGGRRSATESRITTGMSTSRLKTPVEYNSALGMDPLSQMMLSNTQQFYDFEQKYAIAGNMLQPAQSFVNATPASIAGAYNFVPVDGSAPIDRQAQANFWKELIMQTSRDPLMRQEWNIGEMVAHVMKMQGERNVDRFRIVPKILPPGVAPGAGGGGNVVPLNPGGGANVGTGGTRISSGRGAPGSSGGNFQS